MAAVNLIEIEQQTPGFEGFFGTWLCRDDHMNVIVDVGPANSADRLISSLVSMGVDRIDYILLTHIHIDHCGALSAFLAHFPSAKVICHEKGIRFLIDPGKLWEGSLQVLGELARGYGRPLPVREECLIAHTRHPINDLAVIETPGHAPHHLSFCYKNMLFAGEAGGNSFCVAGLEYIRPATPPRFFLEVFLSSLDKLLSLKDQTLYYAHFGSAEGSHKRLRTVREQLLHWKTIIFHEMKKGHTDLIDRCVETLIQNDPNLSAFQRMTPEMQRRERIFLANSVSGFVGFLQEEEEAEQS